MRVILKEDFVRIPEEDKVTVKVKSRKVTVKGPKGEITKDLSHVGIEIKIMKTSVKKKAGLYARIRMWNGAYKQACAVTTVKSLISNMIIGVTEGFRYKMRLVCNQFPINITIPKDGSSLEIKNFLGGKKSHLIKMPPFTKVVSSKDVKDELVFDGIDNAAISLACARTNQACQIGKKDERKFLDGIFVSEKTLTNPKEE